MGCITDKTGLKRYYIYRYRDVRTGSIIYVGKTKRDLRERILEHESELKFLPYLPYAEISYYALGSHAAMDVHEKYWIHTWQPILNVVDKLDVGERTGMGFTISDVHWKSFVTYVSDAVPEEPPVSDIDPGASLYETLCREEEQLEHLHAFLELAFELYTAGDFDEDCSYLVVPWDLDQYPIPDWISVSDESMGKQVIGIYVSATKGLIPNTYDVRVYISALRGLLHVWPDYFSGKCVEFASRRLALDEQFGN